MTGLYLYLMRTVAMRIISVRFCTILPGTASKKRHGIP